MYDLLIIGAGPFGISLSILAKHYGLNFLMVGRTNEFFKNSVPRAMIMRTFVENHVDPLGRFTVRNYLEELGVEQSNMYPIPVEAYIGYLDWLMKNYEIPVQSSYVSRLSAAPDSSRERYFEATDEHGTKIVSRSVVIAIGQKHFYHIPKELIEKIPNPHLFHSSQILDFSKLKGKSVLIVGGRQSAFEWAALASEAGAKEVHLTYRHATPKFKNSELKEWGNILRIIDALPKHPNWFQELPLTSKKNVESELFSLGRLHIEKWLETRTNSEGIFRHEFTTIESAEKSVGERLKIKLSDNTSLMADYVIAATGYNPQIKQIPFLSHDTLLKSIAVEDGLPLLDENFNSNIDGLYFTSSLATKSFGPFFNLTMPTCSSATIIIADVQRNLDRQD